MKIEIRCPSCHKGLLVEERSARDGMLCPACASAAPPPQPREPEAASVSLTEAPSASGSPRSADGAPAEPGAVVCPRCRLHFVPRGQASEVRAEERYTVLVVEDMEYFRQVAHVALAPKYRVLAARSVGEGISILAGKPVDLVVLDLTLEGGEEGRQLLSYAASRGCPVLIYTAKDESEIYGESWEELKRLGARDIVIKGMNVGESLARKADEILGVPLDDEALDLKS